MDCSSSNLGLFMKYIRVGLIGGLSLASLHLCWVLLVASGWAQPFLDWIFKLHMLDSPFRVQTFSLRYAAILLVVTFSIGLLYGVVFELIRTAIHTSRREGNNPLPNA